MNLVKIVKNLDLMLNTQFLYQQNAHFILYDLINHSKFQYENFIGLQRSIGQQKGAISNFDFFQKFIKKHRIINKKFGWTNHLYWSVLSLDFFRRILVLHSNCYNRTKSNL